MCIILFLAQCKKKMEEINKRIKKFDSLSYNAQCKHVKTKLLSFKTKDVPYTMFFKKLYILLDKLPWDLKETNIEICVGKVLFINLWDRFEEEKKYFYEDIGLIKTECIKLPNDTYLVAIPLKIQINTYIFLLQIKIMITVSKRRK